MLEKLDSVDWASLQHAYGSAADIPNLLRSLLSEDEQIRDNAIYELFGNIHHQGTVYEASSYAIPFLMEFLNCPEFLEKVDIAVLVICIAGYYDVCAPGESEGKISQIIRQVRLAALPHIPQLLPYLQLPDLREEIGYEAALMFSRYPEHFELAIPALENAISAQTDEDIKEEMQTLLDDIKKCNRKTSV
jgi:hypothetical protein